MGIKVGEGVKFLFFSVAACIFVLYTLLKFSSRTEAGPKVEVQRMESPVLDNTSVSKKATEITPKVEVKAKTNPFKPIDGAFGKRLGSHFDPDSATETGTMLFSRDKTYHFNPVDPYPGLDTYYVLLTPITHRIFGIWAQKEINDSDACKNEQDILMRVLRKKYGPSDNPDENCWLCFRTFTIKQGSRSVETTCSTGLILRYKDHALEKLAEKEHAQLDEETRKSVLAEKNRHIQSELNNRNTKGF